MRRPDPVRLEVCHQLLAAICEEAGSRLQQSAISPNIRQRRDFSVALFDGDARLVAQAAHIPVHLGSAQDSVLAVRAALELAPGDVAVLNDPYDGGTHLPDVTMVAPVFARRHGQPDWFVACRAHHADIGGATPGSMGIARDLFGEGLVIPPVLLCRGGALQTDVLRLLLANVRGAQERQLDLAAQQACLSQLAQRIASMQQEWGRQELSRYARHLMDYTERQGRAVVDRLRPGVHIATDALEDDGLGSGPLAIALRLSRRRGKLEFDFRASADQADGGLNANRSVVLAACAYALRCLCPDRLPTNDGLFRLLEVRTRPGSLLDPVRPAPVAGGNVETSQRLVDVCLQALALSHRGSLPALSAGTMSNLSAGGRGLDGAEFAFYETLPGGAGAGPSRPGRSAIQTHMTNTRNTPVEEQEARYPILVRRCTVRRGSGGPGARAGGDGIEKEIEALRPMDVSFLGERHLHGPAGAAGGMPGKPGSLEHVRGGVARRLPSKSKVLLAAHDRIRVRTPGGGGHGQA
jgi:N-methylhydantoinase B